MQGWKRHLKQTLHFGFRSERHSDLSKSLPNVSKASEVPDAKMTIAQMERFGLIRPLVRQCASLTSNISLFTVNR